ncbi:MULTISPECIES: universal stress protein [Photobacterium]|uniref:Universal stress protein n=1 Tax=Photobacterium ganghwense TaxID=320778 RepID=A0A0J1H1T6_9GAMM|nr:MULTISPECIES: universal stress protein [Photobacterium]KLV05775.1 universal stress global response regulator UspA [Photobacterium ganghwense]MBV1839224.1 universal stress protein [Photobacterium ganghwense]PSU06313.1 universal stress global response regulator UspA [Photobacterium ganghwense]QSV14163.1 universal stress protein [Photobacterium ganghwense]
MAYKHILVAIDLSEDSAVLVTKAAKLAEALEAKLSLIHIDVNYAELYTGLIDINLSEAQHRMADDAQKQLQALAAKANYPVAHTLVGSGDLSDEICHAIDDLHIELVVCGHHQDFWSKILSSAKQLINRSPVDMLMIPLK